MVAPGRDPVRDRREQGAGIVLPWIGQDFCRGTDLDDAACAHHRRAIGNTLDDSQIVADEKHTEPLLGAEPVNQVENLRADGDVERGDRLVAVPVVALFGALWQNQTRPELAALAAVLGLAAVALIRPVPGHRLTPKLTLDAVVATGRAAGPLILITGAAGMIIELVSLTGLGFSIAADVIAASGGNLFALLALVAVVAIVFGMGMPTVAVYVVLATILAPALTRLGLSGMQAHLFIRYFGMMSMLTPPVALASITAARIAGADIWRTSFRAVRLAWPAYVVPVLFALSPALLMRGGIAASGFTAITALLGTGAISCAAASFARGPLSAAERAAFAVAGLALLMPPGLGTWAIAANLIPAATLMLLPMRSRPTRDVPKRNRSPAPMTPRASE